MVVTSAHSADRERPDRLIVITSIGNRERSKATLGLSLVSRGLDQECRRLPTDGEAASAAAPAGSFTSHVSLERPVGETCCFTSRKNRQRKCTSSRANERSLADPIVARRTWYRNRTNGRVGSQCSIDMKRPPGRRTRRASSRARVRTSGLSSYMAWSRWTRRSCAACRSPS
jgi:hypothetical protein